MHVCMYVSMYVCIFIQNIHIYIYIYTHTHTYIDFYTTASLNIFYVYAEEIMQKYQFNQKLLIII